MRADLQIEQCRLSSGRRVQATTSLSAAVIRVYSWVIDGVLAERH